MQLESQINNLEQDQMNLHTNYKSQLEQIEENMKSEREAKVKSKKFFPAKCANHLSTAMLEKSNFKMNVAYFIRLLEKCFRNREL